jgi:hypothetical protein
MVGTPGATAVDLVAAHVFDAARNGEREMRAAFASRVAGENALSGTAAHAIEVVRHALADLLTEAFEDPKARRVIGLAQLLRAAATLCQEARSETRTETACASRAIKDRCRESIDESIVVQSSGLRLLLDASGRRPRPGFDEERIVDLLQCMFDGYVGRFLFESDRWPIAGFADLAWSTVLGLTEPAEDGQSAREHREVPAREHPDTPTAIDLNADTLSRLVDGVPGAWRLAIELLLRSAPVARTPDGQSHDQSGTGLWGQPGEPPPDVPPHPRPSALVDQVARIIAAEPRFEGRVDPQSTAALLADCAMQGIQGRPGWEALLCFLETVAGPDPPTSGTPTNC